MWCVVVTGSRPPGGVGPPPPQFPDGTLTDDASARARVLVVDDEALFAKALFRVLSRDYDVTVVEDGGEARSLFEQGQRFDVILCDIHMPVMSGVQLHAFLAGHIPGQSDKMIFITGGNLDEQASELVDRYENFEKPCDVKQLCDAVRRRVNAR